jgi:Transcriptional regulator
MRNLEKDEIEMAARRELMLKEGFRVFAEKGIDAVSMQQVADACGLGVATLYRYFNTKLALVLAIGTRKWEEYGEYATALRAERNADAMTAAEELDFYFDFYIDLYRNHKDLLRFNQSFNNFVQHEGASMEQLAPYRAAIGRIARFFHGVYEKGKRDGTIRTDQPEDKMFASTSHIMLAVAVRYAQGLLYVAEDEADRTEEFLMLKRLLLREYLTA